MSCPCLALRRARILLGFFAAALCVAAAPASALSLADLKSDGFSVVSDGVEFSEFKVKVKGLGLDDDLASHEVIFEDGGLWIELAHGFENKRGKVKLKYVASAVGGELTDAVLDVVGDDVKVKSRIKGVGKLQFASAKPDAAVLGLDLGELERIKVKTGIRLKNLPGSPDAQVGSRYAMPAPEPGTAALCALGLAGLAAARRRRGSA